MEMLCQKVRPSEWSPLIKEWRSRARYVDQREGVIALFRSVVEEIVQRRLAGATQVSLVDELAASADAQVGAEHPQASSVVHEPTGRRKSSRRGSQTVNGAIRKC